MPSKNPAQRLRDIVDNIDAIGLFTTGMEHDTFAGDQKTVYALELKDRHPEIDWIAVAAAGNVYRHEYEGMDEDLIWHTVRHDLDVLRAAALSELGT
jgi:uncharacterized protein with HEPN domain